MVNKIDKVLFDELIYKRKIWLDTPIELDDKEWEDYDKLKTIAFNRYNINHHEFFNLINKLES